MGHHVIEYDQECKSCKGTGLYVGFAERDGFAVVCHACNGTGCQHVKVEYDDFESRKDREGIKTVIQANPGIGVGGNLNFGGLPYTEWKAGATFNPGSEMREYTCPAWWYQSADYSKKPDWPECWGAGIFSGCKHFCNKSKCWERFDNEQQH